MNHRSSPRNIMGHPNPPCVDLKWILEVRDCDLLTLKGLNNTALVSFILLLSGFLFFNIVKNVSVENSRYNSRKSHQTGGFCGNYSGCFLVEQKGSSSFTKKPLYLCTVLLKNNPFVAKTSTWRPHAMQSHLQGLHSSHLGSSLDQMFRCRRCKMLSDTGWKIPPLPRNCCFQISLTGRSQFLPGLFQRYQCDRGVFPPQRPAALSPILALFSSQTQNSLKLNHHKFPPSALSAQISWVSYRYELFK